MKAGDGAVRKTAGLFPISLFTIPNSLFSFRCLAKAKSTKRTHYFGLKNVCMTLETNNLTQPSSRMALPKKHPFSTVFMVFDHDFQPQNPPFAHCNTLETAQC
jgi:hypothetical protein